MLHTHQAQDQQQNPYRVLLTEAIPPFAGPQGKEQEQVICPCGLLDNIQMETFMDSPTSWASLKIAL